MTTYLKYLLPVTFLTNVLAGELTLETKPFAVVQTLPAKALPEESIPLRLDPLTWEAFNIVSIGKHGSTVKKGDTLVAFDTEDIDLKIEDTRHAIDSGRLAYEQAWHELETFEKTLPEQLAQLERAAQVAAEELEYFTKTSRKASEESAEQNLKYQQQSLESTREELKQLLKMYEADDITEETEEIILKNQRASVEFAEFEMRMEVLNHKRKLEVTIPREAISLTEKRDTTAIEFDKAKKELPRSLEIKKHELAQSKTALGRLTEGLSKLENDRKLFVFKADSDGQFYHGSISDGKWITGDLVKGLEPKGAAPIGKVFASFIPATTNIVVNAFPTQDAAVTLLIGTEGFATLSGREEVSIPVKITAMSQTPAPDETYATTLVATWPKDLKPIPGQDLTLHIISYSSENALAVPTKSLTLSPKGWSVDVKLADGKTERRIVVRGRSSGDMTEITSGLEAGQVLIVP